jgi:hypothetical protein
MWRFSIFDHDGFIVEQWIRVVVPVVSLSLRAGLTKTFTPDFIGDVHIPLGKQNQIRRF